jgi:hypothetical protein
MRTARDRSERKAMIDTGHKKLSVRRQAALLGVNSVDPLSERARRPFGNPGMLLFQTDLALGRLTKRSR